MRAVLLTMAAVALAFAPAPLSRPSRGQGGPAADLRAVQGEWVVTTYKVHGLDLSANLRTRVTFADDRFSWCEGDRPPVEWGIRLAPGRPPLIDFTEPSTKKRHPGIYHLQGDTLTICTTEPHVGARPPAFDGRKFGYELMVLKRRGR
jgi:uncharacterized protein (TIGR03067 family)